ncbi:MAG: hypothetical protein Q8Q20_01700 [bacterium]|nr:hypothetical protein [bacterium]
MRESLTQFRFDDGDAIEAETADRARWQLHPEFGVSGKVRGGELERGAPELMPGTVRESVVHVAVDALLAGMHIQRLLITN